MRSTIKWKVSFPKMGDEKKILSALGLCVRAGKAVFGVPMICDAMRKGGEKSPVLVLSAADISDNTQKRITDKCGYYKVKHIKLGCGGETLAAALGKTSFLAAVAITDKNMSMMVEKYI